MQAIKIPPMPGQSRSLLHFTPTTQIKREIDVANVADAIKQEKENNAADGGVDVVSAAAGGPANGGTVKVTLDHDYFGYSAAPSSVPPAPSAAKRAKISILTPSRNRPLVVKEEEEVRFAK